MNQDEIIMRLEEIQFNCFDPDIHFELQDLIDDIKGLPVSSIKKEFNFMRKLYDNELPEFFTDVLSINGLKEV